jgi:molybdopterin converting factor small subunit
VVDQVTGIEVRYFAAAADAAGREKETVDLAVGSDLAALRAALIERHGADMERVLSVAAYLVEPGAGGGELTRDLTYPAGAKVDVLPPFAGG